ncbi:DoxX-like family protein [Nevskia soli]|jgi:uncharacterized membrane protein YphA (DoxX/SURF4 family)|uniref:DoxX-like family protein n=1 Tax=Nevskia soli TaxID=418856 RepID=UPI0015D741E8|nr:DoxX-like family protein [Nevskia soli]
MHDAAIAFPALVIIRGAVAAVWLYEGLWNKVLGNAQRESDIVAMVPKLGPLFGKWFLKLLGVIEVAIAAWILSGIYPGACAIVQIALLVVLNINGLLWARQLIHDPAGMVVKNAAFLVLVWACGALPGTRP